MQLSQIKADIRLRSPWEAVDLGFAMVQTWSKTIYAPWALFLLGFATLLWSIVPEDSLWLAPLILWWSKPVYDRLLLYILSQELFSLSEGGLWYSLKKLPSLMLGNGLMGGLTIRRLSASRGFNLPIWQLEGLKGPARKKRQNILQTTAHSQAVWLMIACTHIEVILNFAFFGLVFLWLPSSMQENFFSQFILEESTETMGYWIELLSYIFYTLSIIIMEPFYVAGCFGLYINRRTQLESWDIELVFRNMADRLQSLKTGLGQTQPGKLNSIFLALILSTTALGFSLTSEPVLAADEPTASSILPAEQSKPVIEALMKTEALSHTKKISYWTLKEFNFDQDEEPDLNGFEQIILTISKLFAVAFESVLWILLLVAIALLIVYRDRWLSLFQVEAKAKTKKTIPDVLFGMDIRPDSLPDDIPAAASAFWQQGKHREALSLLYRGALMRLVTQDQILLEDSHTEGDVLKLSRKVLHRQREQYLEKLTHVWRRAAYAHRFPDETEAQYLFQHWYQDFANNSHSVDEMKATV